MFKVRKVLNNNALLTIDTQTQEEVIFIGNGVGFGQHMLVIGLRGNICFSGISDGLWTFSC